MRKLLIMKLYKYAIAILFMLPLFSMAPLAYGSDAYTIEQFEVILEGVNQSHARQTAIDQATDQGFRQLLRSLTAQSAWPRHEEVIAKVNMRRVLRKFNIISEEMSPEYKAKFELQFNREYVRNLLTNLSIPFSEVGAGPVLLLPLLDLHTSRLLWEETNPWRVKLEQAAAKAGLVRFILPIGDPQEMMMLTPEMVAFGAGDMIGEIARKYNAEVAVVARFKMGMTDDGQREALLDLVWYGGKEVAPQYLQVPLQSKDGLDTAMTQVGQQAILALEEAWRRLYMLDFDRPGRVLLHYAAGSLSELEKLRNQLAGIAIVDDVMLRAVSRKQAVLQINFFGTEPRLQALSAEQGLKIRRWNERWVIDLGDEENTVVYGALSTQQINDEIPTTSVSDNAWQENGGDISEQQ